MSKIDSLMQQTDSLPFDPNQQAAVLGHMMLDKTFFLLCNTRIKAEWFVSSNQRAIYTILQHFYEVRSRVPTSVDEFLGFDDFLAEDNKIRNAYKIEVSNCIKYSGIFPQDGLVPRLTLWLKARILYNAVTNAVNLYNENKVLQAVQVYIDSSRDMEKVTFTEETEYPIYKLDDLLANREVELDDALTFGIDAMDKLMVPDSRSGGMLRGDTTVLLAPTNIGKTTSMITVASHNLLLDRDILFITHEGRPADISMKLWQAMLDMNFAQMRDARTGKDPEMNEFVEYIQQMMKDHLVYVPVNKAGFTIEELDPIVRRKIEEKRAKSGKGFDLLINDYPAKLTSQKAAKGNLQKRHIDDIVYNYFVQWALEYNFHSLSAIQANREGNKINRKLKGYEHRLLVAEDMSEAFGPATTATNIITVNRDQEAMNNNYCIYLICKSRSNETGWAVVCRSNYAHAITHSNALGCTWYKGLSSMSDKVNDLLNQFKGQAIPQHLVTD